MKVKFTVGQNFDYTISSDTINGIDLSEIQEGESFSLPEMRDVGVIKAKRANGGLYVTLQQACTAYRVPVGSHDWRESDWIDAADFDPNTCYIKPTAAPEGTVTQWYSGTETLPNGQERMIEGWTVVQPEPEATE